MSKDVQRYAFLLDFYAPLLTPRQQELMSSYYLDDLSLGEIATESGISRQAVHDQIKRAEQQLLACEERLGLVSEFRAQQARLQAVLSLLQQAASESAPSPPLAEALRLLAEVCGPATVDVAKGPEPRRNGHGTV